MIEFIIGIILIILALFVPDDQVVGGAAKKFTPQHEAIWFDPKIFVTEMAAGRPWWIGAGFEPSRWTPIVPKKWSSQVELNNRNGLTVANERYTMKWCDWRELPDVPETEYLRKMQTTTDAVKGNTAFLMNPYLREWQRLNLWPAIPKRARLFDIGIGTGRSQDLWRAHSLEVWGVEPNTENVATIRRRHMPNVQVQPWGGQREEIRTWIAAGTMDAVMMSYSITFFFESVATLDALVANVSHVTHPGSRFALIGMDGDVVSQWFKTAKSDHLDNDLFTIDKKYDKQSGTFGRKIEITIKNPNTLVTAQREYLVDFSHLRKVFAKAGFKCTKDTPVAAPEYIGEWPRKFIEAQRLLIFDKL